MEPRVDPERSRRVSLAFDFAQATYDFFQATFDFDLAIFGVVVFLGLLY